MTDTLASDTKRGLEFDECPNCGLDFPDGPICVGVKGLRECPNCGADVTPDCSVDANGNHDRDN
jgi:Zn-finger nucleic acid-binding protein